MLKRNLSLALRNFVRNRHYTVLNVAGLGLGITACIIIFLVIRYDTRFDKFHSKYENIYRVVQQSQSASGESFSSVTPYPLPEALRNDLPHLSLVTQLHYEGDGYLTIGAEKLEVQDVVFADSLFFELFSFEVVKGNPRKDLAHPGKVFVTESLAETLFHGDAMQRTIRLNNEVELEVAGILADPPPTSHIQFSMVVSYPSLTSAFLGGLPLNEWGLAAAGFAYVVLPTNITTQQVNSELAALGKKYMESQDAARKKFSLQAMEDIHFDEQYTDNPTEAVNAQFSDVVILSILGIFILLVACINFVNLATALAVKRSKEIGIRKTLGARQHQLTGYFLTETFLLTLFSTLVSLAIAQLSLPFISTFLDRSLSFSVTADPVIAVLLVGLIGVVTLCSGFYPALVLSRYEPVKVLKNRLGTTTGSRITLRKALVVFQFIIVQLLVIGTLVVSDQMHLFRSKALGFDQEAIVTLPVPDREASTLQTLRERLAQVPGVQHVSLAIGTPTSDNNLGTTFYLSDKGRQEVHSVHVKAVDIEYKDTYQLTLSAGRWFTPSEEQAASVSGTDATPSYVYVINESAMRKLGFSDPQEVIGKRITSGLNEIDAEVIGVVRDFHVASLHEAIEPVVLINFPYFYFEAGVKIAPGAITTALPEIEKTWTTLFPDALYQYKFLDQSLAALYEKDQKTFTLIRMFAAISIFVGCLGLYGLVSFLASQKVKEVGIRKVLGATPASIMSLFSGEFVKLIALAFLIAAPLAFWLMNQWLENFTYRVSLSAVTFIIAVGITLFIALATISLQSVRAAMANPVDSLRNE